ncbi:MAG: rRNA adenine methyltransferase [Siphonobacter sp.]
MHTKSIFDPENPVTRLCVEGMMLESHSPEESRRLFMKAWEDANTVLEASCAAHYLARFEPDNELKWNQIALDKALASDHPDAARFLPSLYLNLGKSHEMLQHWENARIHYRKAQEHLCELIDDGYGQMIKKGIEAALERIP